MKPNINIKTDNNVSSVKNNNNQTVKVVKKKLLTVHSCPKELDYSLAVPKVIFGGFFSCFALGEFQETELDLRTNTLVFCSGQFCAPFVDVDGESQEIIFCFLVVLTTRSPDDPFH